MDHICNIASLLAEDISSNGGMIRTPGVIVEGAENFVQYAMDIYNSPISADAYAIMADEIIDNTEYRYVPGFLQSSQTLPGEAMRLLDSVRKVLGNADRMRRDVYGVFEQFMPHHRILHRSYIRAMNECGAKVVVREEGERITIAGWNYDGPIHERTPMHRRIDKRPLYESHTSVVLTSRDDQKLKLDYSTRGRITGDTPKSPESAIAFVVCTLFRMASDPFNQAIELVYQD